MTELTEQERESLRGLGQGQVPAAVERILAARLARLAALADEWERFDCTEKPDVVPACIDVPDDYEYGINECGHTLLALLAGNGA